MSPAQMLASLGNPLDIESRQRDTPERHRTLRSTLMWSYALLNDAERSTCAALSVFADGWSIEAAEEICGCDIDVLQALVEHSLVRVRFNVDGESRSWMLELVHTFADESLDAERRDVLRERLTARSLRLLGLRSPQLNTTDQDVAFAWFDAELEDLRAVAHRLIDTDDPRAGRCVAEFEAYLWRRGRAEEGNLLVGQALTVSSMPDVDRALLHRNRAANAMIRGDLSTAEDHLERALALIETLDERSLRLQLLANYGHLFMLRGEHEAARDVWERCRAEAVEYGEHRTAALIDWNFGSLAAAASAWDDAVIHFEVSRSFHRSIDDTIGVAWLSGLLGWAHANRGDHAAAGSALLEAFQTYARVGLGPGLESALIGLAEFLRRSSRAEAARAVAWFDHLHAEGMEPEHADLESIGEIRLDVGPVVPRNSGDAVECATWAIQLLTE